HDVADGSFLDLHGKRSNKCVRELNTRVRRRATQSGRSASPNASRTKARSGPVAGATGLRRARTVDESTRVREIDRWGLDAASARDLSGLEAFLAEPGTPLRRLERHGGFFTARRTRRDRFHPFARHAGADRASRALTFTGLAPLRLVLEVLIGEELLLA